MTVMNNETLKELRKIREDLSVKYWSNHELLLQDLAKVNENIKSKISIKEKELVTEKI